MVKYCLRGFNGDFDVMIIVLWVFVDGLIGDLVLVVVDGEIMVFNMNDVCLVDLDVLVLEFGYIDVYML